MAAAPQNPEAFVRWFRQAAPYVHAFRGRTFVIGFGGEMFAERERLVSFVHDLNLLAALGIRLVLVHGARPQIEAELKSKGRALALRQGLRITDEAAADGGQARRRRAARGARGAASRRACRTRRWPGARIRVASGNYITAQPIGVRKGTDFQFTGAVRKVDAAAIERELDAGEVVLVPHLGYSPTGEVFNLAWEDVAESVAIALKADKLLMFTDRLPAGRKGEVLAELTAGEAEALLKKGRPLGADDRCARARGACGRAPACAARHLISRRTPRLAAARALHPYRASAP